MTDTRFPAYEEMVERLDTDYIAMLGAEVRHALAAGESVAFSYAPGDMTAYDLVIAPVSRLMQIKVVGGGNNRDGGWDVPSSTTGGFGWFVVSQVNGETWSMPVQLRPGCVPHHTFIYEKTIQNFASACALTALFEAIAGDNPNVTL